MITHLITRAYLRSFPPNKAQEMVDCSTPLSIEAVTSTTCLANLGVGHIKQQYFTLCQCNSGLRPTVKSVGKNLRASFRRKQMGCVILSSYMRVLCSVHVVCVCLCMCVFMCLCVCACSHCKLRALCTLCVAKLHAGGAWVPRS
jgi:hypothetical protein